jgi:hypothetical protein
MAIQISGTNVIDNSRNVVNVVGVNASGVVTATSFVGDGSQLTGIAAGGSGDFNTGITSSVTFTPLGYETTAFTFPSTAGYQYLVNTINVANVSDNVGVGTSINIILSIADADGKNEQTYLAYNIPIANGGVLEILKNPFVAPRNAVMKAWTTRGSDYVGLSSVSEIYMNYTATESTEYIVSYASTVSIGATGPVGVFTSSTYPSNIQSIHLTNRTDDGDYPVSIGINNGVATTYLVKDLIVPRYAAVDLVAQQKRIEVDDIIEVTVGMTTSIDVIIAGKQITS